MLAQPSSNELSSSDRAGQNTFLTPFPFKHDLTLMDRWGHNCPPAGRSFRGVTKNYRKRERHGYPNQFCIFLLSNLP